MRLSEPITQNVTNFFMRDLGKVLNDRIWKIYVIETFITILTLKLREEYQTKKLTVIEYNEKQGKKYQIKKKNINK